MSASLPGGARLSGAFTTSDKLQRESGSEPLCHATLFVNELVRQDCKGLGLKAPTNSTERSRICKPRKPTCFCM